MEITGYFAAALIGISLGLIGGGGSILTVPVLVYLFNITPGLAVFYSLFIVGVASLFGSVNSYIIGYVNVKKALLFALPSVATVIITRKFILPFIPEKLGKIGTVTITMSIVTMLLFSVLMIIASVSMIRASDSKKDDAKEFPDNTVAKLLMYGAGIGFVTGLLGAGGGFVLIPVLVMVIGLPVKQAIGTSLLIIALNTLIGFISDLEHWVTDWRFLIAISSMAIVGIFIGTRLSRIVPEKGLKIAFGWFVLITGISILTRELFFK